jgi:hypothetical protein
VQYVMRAALRSRLSEQNVQVCPAMARPVYQQIIKPGRLNSGPGEALSHAIWICRCSDLDLPIVVLDLKMSRLELQTFNLHELCSGFANCLCGFAAVCQL